MVALCNRILINQLLIFATGWFVSANGWLVSTHVHAEPVVTELQPHAIVVCPESFRVPIQRWLDYRATDGLKATVVAPKADASQLRKTVSAASNGQTRYVVLVGDAPTIGSACQIRNQVPTCYVRSTVTSAWGSTPTLCTDLPFGDFDGDLVPEASVGRLAVKDAVQLTGLLDRIIRREQQPGLHFGDADVQLTAGIGGFGMLADTAIESVARSVVTGMLPSRVRTKIAYASLGHRFCPPKAHDGDANFFTNAVIDRYSHGCQFWVYAGHGWINQLDRVPAVATGVPVLDPTSVQQLKLDGDASPIALMLACYTGAFDAAQDSLAESMLVHPYGPTAVMAGSRVTMPYGNATAAVGLVDAIYYQQQPRLGDAWRVTLKKMADQDAENRDASRVMIDALAKLISPSGTKLADERREHMQLYNLLGDPTMRLRHPAPIKVDVPLGFDIGAPVQVAVTSPVSGMLELCVDRPLGYAVGDDANDVTLATMKVDVVADQEARLSVALPEDVTGPLVIRTDITGSGQWASGGAKTSIR